MSFGGTMVATSQVLLLRQRGVGLTCLKAVRSSSSKRPRNFLAV